MGNYDVVVVGGGSAGLGAAIAAARNGIRVAFIQDRPILGGNCSDEIMVPPMGYQKNPVDKANVTGIAEEIYPPQSFKKMGSSKVYEEIVRAEKNIDLFLNTRAVDVQMKNRENIEAVIAINVHTGQRMKFTAPLFVDTTGHGWIGYYAGAESRHGTESRREFNESMAPLKANSHTMGNSTYKIEFKTMTEPVEFKTPGWAYQWKSAKDFDGFSSHNSDAIRPKGYENAVKGRGTKVNNLGGAFTWFAELGGTSNTITDAEKIRDELFRLHIGLWGYQKNYAMVEKTKNKKMVWMNYVPGVRESRRLMGDYIMTQKDFDEQIIHPDTVAFTDWGIDDHHPHGFFTKGTFVIHVYKGRRVSIPYRSLYSKNIKNLFVAGRCMSVSHVALGGVRVQRPMTATGQAVGVAAAMAVREKCLPRDITKKHISELQQQLLKEGCYLIGIKNQDSEDLALSATTKHRAIIDGWNREVKGVSNPVPWRAQPISLKLREESLVSTIHISFEDRFNSAQFDVECLVNGEWTKVVENPGIEKQRRYVFDFPAVKTDRVRFVLKKSSGPIFVSEVRIYK
ncbi:MAG: FAD-dependent oxidoreductase [Lentisphaeraceae bacterium]|nr:FAD-dependent oxidoreductase [Lentisphaeraceae bacterium]